VLALEERRLLATFTVTSTLDDGSTGTLRWAITQANSTSGANTVAFDATVFSSPQTITLKSSQLELSNTGGTEMITGPAAGVTVSGGGASRVFQVDSGVTANLSGLTITGGSISGDNAGGGLFNLGTANLTNCTISGNSAKFANGLEYCDGGGLFNLGTASLNNCTISSNYAFLDGGGLDNRGTANLNNCTISSNNADGGGGLDNRGTANLTNCTFSGNSVSFLGGGLSNYGTASLNNCTISGNSAVDGGGLASNSGGANLTLSDCTVSGNSAYAGGGLDNSASASTVTLTNCTLSGNSAHYGGGLNNIGTATLTDCTLSGNNAIGAGGGVANGGFPTLNLTLTDCTFSSNNAASGGGLDNLTTATLTDCTFSGNSASNGIGSGGLYNYGTATLTDTIVAGNTNPPGASDIGGKGNVSGSYNLIGSGGSGGLQNGVNGNIVLTSLTGLGLAPLGDYGGPTQTTALLPGSLAIGAGTAVSGVTTDQRGFPLDSPTSDIGAFQTQNALVVNTTSDGTGSPAGDLSLRQAVNLANVQPGPATITFDATVFSSPQTISLTNGQLELSNTSGKQTITGPAVGVTVSGGLTSRVFEVDSGVTASLSGLSVTEGYATDSAGGGGLDNWGTTSLTGCTISGNSALYGGGGLNNAGTATLTDCTISGNSAHYGGGMSNYGTATLTDCTISGNSSNNGGGGLYNVGAATLTDTIVAGNTDPFGASDIGGISNVSGGYNLIGTGGSGGLQNAVNGNIVLTDLAGLGLAPQGDYGGPTPTMALLPGSPAIGAGTAVSGVKTDQRGFPLDSPKPDIGAFQTQPALVVNTTRDGIGSPAGELSLRQAVNLANVLTAAATITFDPAVFATAQTITLTIGQLGLANTSGTETIAGPAAGVIVSGGGASRVFQVDSGVTATLSGLTITAGSVSGYPGGGGLYNAGTANLTNCTVSGNNSTFSGGGLDNGGTANLTNCTISGNSANYLRGGGLFNSGTATLTDCTISGNSANYGGGLENYFGTATLTGCTVSGNSANYGGGLENYFGTATLTDTIVAGNTSPSGPNDVGGPSSVSGSNNLIGTGGSGGLQNGVNGNIVLTSLAGLGLAPLGDYGGPTQTMALLPGGLAIAAGTAVSGVTADQRGVPLDSPNPDIGAFQSRGFTITVTSGNAQSTGVGTSFPNPLVVTVSSPYGDPVQGGLVTFTAPASGASASFSGGSGNTTTATIDSNAQAAVSVAANSVPGHYAVTASSQGAASPASFSLANTIAISLTDAGSSNVYTIRLDPNNPCNLEVDYNGTLIYDGDPSVVTSITINELTGTDTVDVEATFPGTPVTINGGTGSDTTNVASPANTLDPVQGLVTVNGQGANTTLNINDSGTSSDEVYILSATQFTRTPWTPGPLGNPTQTVNYFNIGYVNVYGGSAYNLWGPESTLAGTTTSLYSGGGGINHPNEFLINGPADDLDSIQGPVAVHGGGIYDYAIAYDYLNTVGHTYTMTTGMLQRDGIANITSDGVGGFELAAANNPQGHTPSNTVKLLSLGSVVASIIVGTGDTVKVGQNHSLAQILGQATIEGPAKQVTIDDSGETTSGEQVTFGTNSFAPFITGLTPQVIYYSLGTSSKLTVLGGSPPAGSNVGNTFTIQSLPVIDLSIKGGTGNDTFQLQAQPPAGAKLSLNGNGGSDALVGPNVSETWRITGTNAGNVAGASFTNVQNLTGGTGMNVFKFSDGKSVSGAIMGGGDGDWLDYAAYSTNVTVNLATGTATGVPGGVSNVQNVRGGKANNTLTGNSQGNILIGGPGNNSITGGSGRSILIAGKGAGTVTGGSGDDIVIGGYTNYDSSSTANDIALEAILAEWQSSDSYTTRISKIKAGLPGGYKLVWKKMVHDNGQVVTLTGGGGMNWFFEGASDTITDYQSGEQIN
jgi:hypothetical protein